ncbi:hypothetical protein K491DRAFT_710709 [Lophiostoma macrostomum CBS 122681]|uniref:Zn(2)-C6 fungal-type domain-containing protein n=1 Tax=Lophiostoma macrostomum CBS 122681 TaxID=1314788 RepID=A0A6A6TS85_9PLEO|nr:hypothetical protein K491DRAFT_710709 [Lophiostoma macrostomum CBS 122681]
MGKYRSKTGCVTCRTRRVKCDEERPVCGQCSKKNRTCSWETPSFHIRQYQPNENNRAGSSSRDRGQVDGEDGVGEEDEVEKDGDHATDGRQHAPVPRASPFQRSAFHDSGPSSETFSPGAGSSSSGGQSFLPHLFRENSSPSSAIQSGLYAQILTSSEAELVIHYSEHLGRWMDCTDASKQFTRRIPLLVQQCPILLNAVVAFAAKHCKEIPTAEQAYQHCLNLLIDRLNSENVTHDDALLCAIVTLRFVEQLDVALTGGDFEQHLTGASAILTASQGPIIDPAAPTVREAAFWIYVRQCLYTATVHQQPPNLDPRLELLPIAPPRDDEKPSETMMRETGWTNVIVFFCASVVNFCFDGVRASTATRMDQWTQLWEAVQRWKRDRPSSFDAIHYSPASETSVFPQIWFASDWHATAFGFAHFAHILLITYKPSPRFAIRVVGKLQNEDHQVMSHVQELCGVCKCSPSNVGNLILLCHTVFIWGALMYQPRERNAVIELLTTLESVHSWPTAWIVALLTEEWEPAT